MHRYGCPRALLHVGVDVWPQRGWIPDFLATALYRKATNTHTQPHTQDGQAKTATQALALELATTKDKLADAIADLQDRNNNQEEEEQEGGGGVPKRQRPNVVYEG